jgi:hypothetical protein
MGKAADTGLREWALRVLEDNNWNQQDWARRAGIHASTIYRILTVPGYAPRISTLERLSASATSRPEELNDEAVRRVAIPLMSPEQVRRSVSASGVVVPAKGDEGEIKVAVEFHPGFAVKVQAYSQVGGGFTSGDILICRPIGIGLPSDGDLLAVDLGETEGISVARLCQASACHEPLGRLDRQSTPLIGIVLEMIRRVS